MNQKIIYLLVSMFLPFTFFAMEQSKNEQMVLDKELNDKLKRMLTLQCITQADDFKVSIDGHYFLKVTKLDLINQDNQTIELFKTSNHKLIETYNGIDAQISPDSSLLMIMSKKNHTKIATIIDLFNYQIISTFKHLDESVQFLKFSPYKGYIVFKYHNKLKICRIKEDKKNVLNIPIIIPGYTDIYFPYVDFSFGRKEEFFNYYSNLPTDLKREIFSFTIRATIEGASNKEEAIHMIRNYRLVNKESRAIIDALMKPNSSARKQLTNKKPFSYALITHKKNSKTNVAIFDLKNCNFVRYPEVSNNQIKLEQLFEDERQGSGPFLKFYTKATISGIDPFITFIRPSFAIITIRHNYKDNGIFGAQSTPFVWEIKSFGLLKPIALANYSIQKPTTEKSAITIKENKIYYHDSLLAKSTIKNPHLVASYKNHLILSDDPFCLSDDHTKELLDIQLLIYINILLTPDMVSVLNMIYEQAITPQKKIELNEHQKAIYSMLPIAFKQVLDPYLVGHY